MGWSQKGKEVGFSCMGKILPTKKDWRTGIRDLTTMSQFLAEKTWWRWLMGKEEGSDMATQICQGRRGIRSDKDGGHERGIDDME